MKNIKFGQFPILGLFIFLFLINPLSSYSQMNGWPLNTNSSVTISSNVTLGSNRCRVTASSASGSNYNLTYYDLEGGFAVGEWAMMTQMHGTGMGAYTLVVIQSISTTVNSISVKPYNGNGYSNGYPNWSFAGTDDRVQLVKVSKYWDLTVTGVS